LDLHFSAIRDLEIRLAECAPLDGGTVDAINAIDGDHQNGDRVVEVAELHIDVIALGLSCGYTHAVTLQIGNGNDGTRYRWNGEQFPSYHWISHRIFSDGADGDPIPDATNTDPATGEDWSTCTPIKGSSENPAMNPFTARFDGEACEPVLYQDWDREEDPSIVPGAIIPPIVSPAPPLPTRPEGAPFELCYEVNVLRFGGEDAMPVFGTESALL
jgi:hypothetical protein